MDESTRPLLLMDTLGLGQRITGMERYSIEMLNALYDDSARGFDFLVISHYKSAVRGRFPCLYVRGRPEVAQQTTFHRIVHRHRPAAVLAMGLGCTASPHWPFVLLLHDAVPWSSHRLTGRRTRWYAKPAWTKALRSRHCRGVITVSPSAGVALRAIFPNCKILVETGEGTTGIVGMARPDGVRTPFLLFVGTDEPRKNLPRVMEAFARISAEPGFEDVSLIVVGRRGWTRQAELSHPRARRLGYVSDEHLAWLYQHAAGLVFTPLEEGFGLPAIEAAARGCPVLASDIAPLRALGSECFLFCDPLDTGSIAEGMRRLRIRNINSASLKALAAKHQWVSAELKLADALRSIISERRVNARA